MSKIVLSCLNRLIEQTYSWLEEGVFREFEMDMYTQLYLKSVTNRDLLYSTWSSAQCYVAAWMGELFGGEWVWVYGWLSPFTVHLKLSQHFKLVIPQDKIKSSRKKIVLSCWNLNVFVFPNAFGKEQFLFSRITATISFGFA